MSEEIISEDFNDQVIQASETKHVLVDFWASWCNPCKVLTPVLEKLEEEYQGRFSLVKINTEEEPEIALKFNVVSIPNVRLFYKGEVIDQFMGAIPENMVRTFLDKNIPPAELDKLKELVQAGNFKEAASILLESNVENKMLQDILQDITLHYISELPDSQGELTNLIKHFPDTSKYSMLKNSLLDFFSREQTDENMMHLKNLTQESSLKMSLDHFLQRVESLTGQAQEIARKELLTCLHILGSEHPLSMEYRKKLSKIIY